MKICAMMSVGNDREFFRSTLDSIYWFFDEIHVVFGSFGHTRHMHGENGLPKDGTAGILLESGSEAYPDPDSKIVTHVCKDGFKSWGESYNYVLRKMPDDTDWVMHVNSGDIYLQEDLDYLRERMRLTDKRVIYWPMMHLMRTLRWVNVAGEELRLFRYSPSLMYSEDPSVCGGVLLDRETPVWHLGPSGRHFEFTAVVRTFHTCHARSPEYLREKVAMLAVIDRLGMRHHSVTEHVEPEPEDYRAAEERLRRTSGFLYFTDPEFASFDIRVANNEVPGIQLYEGPYPESLQRHPRFVDEVLGWWGEHPIYRGRGVTTAGMDPVRARWMFDTMLEFHWSLKAGIAKPDALKGALTW
jgi:hypothetical protein